jgi:hypothetical protein
MIDWKTVLWTNKSEKKLKRKDHFHSFGIDGMLTHLYPKLEIAPQSMSRRGRISTAL